jgi:hypothetical protein
MTYENPFLLFFDEMYKLENNKRSLNIIHFFSPLAVLACGCPPPSQPCVQTVLSHCTWFVEDSKIYSLFLCKEKKIK